MLATDVYKSGDAKATAAYLARLEATGQQGRLAAALFRAALALDLFSWQTIVDPKKKRYIRQLGRAKEDAIKALAELLDGEGTAPFGWRYDGSRLDGRNILHVDLPNGQVSFMSLRRYVGPKYTAGWDGSNATRQRVLAFCDRVLGEQS